ncbi:MAG: hypothetical protein QNJ46_27620 [Leptolyngbyaceae cyanobacterium MO_188.B28]|nr:hypothetical protein [Leptolyngbyaceae cyanobacterium MO_188.B28]
MKSRIVSFRLPCDLVEIIESEARSTGQSRTRVVTTALAKAYDCSVPLPPRVTPDQLQCQLDELRAEVEVLRESNNLLRHLELLESQVSLGDDVENAIASLSTKGRSAWMVRVLSEAAQKELIPLRVMKSTG